MNCHKVYQALSAYMDGELPGVDTLVVRQHLASCQACRAEYEGLRYTKQLLSRLRMKEPRPDLPQDIVRRLQLENRRATNFSVDALWERFAERLRIIPPVARNLAFGAALAVIGFGFVAMQADNPDDIQWNVASASASPLAPAPSLPDSGINLNPGSLQRVGMYSEFTQMDQSSAFPSSNTPGSAVKADLSAPTLTPEDNSSRGL